MATLNEPLYDDLMHGVLLYVFNERAADARLDALQKFFAKDAVFYEPRSIVEGRLAISAAIEGFLGNLPADFSFAPSCESSGHHGAGYVRWQGGTPERPSAINGGLVALLADRQIVKLYFFVDPKPPRRNAPRPPV